MALHFSNKMSIIFKEMLGSKSVHDKSHYSSMSDDREVNFESYGENNDVEYDK